MPRFEHYADGCPDELKSLFACRRLSWDAMAYTLYSDTHTHTQHTDIRTHTDPFHKKSLLYIFGWFAFCAFSPAALPKRTPHQDVGVHELAQARFREKLRGGDQARAHLQGEVRPPGGVPQERICECPRALRHNESGPEYGYKGIWHCHAARLGPQVSTQ